MDTDNKSKEYLVTGNLDKPLGISDPRPASYKSKLVYLSLFGVVVLAGLSGFAFNKYLSSPPDTIEVAKQPDRNDPTASDNTVTASNKNILKKRPDLAIDENAPALQELQPLEDIPSIIPRRRPANIKRETVLAHLPDPELYEKTSTGKLPVVSPDGLRPLDVYARQADTEGNFGVARIVIIVGGLGISQSSSEQAIRTLPAGVTLAFAPYGNSLSRWMEKARKGGHELLLQLPMEPYGYPQTNAGKHSLLSSAQTQANLKELHWSLGRITNYVGVMNYLGGKMLTSPDALAPIFDDLAARGLMFVDDGSIRSSMAKNLSKPANLPFARAHITIDATRTRAYIQKQLQNLEIQAKRSGLAIGVATAFPDTIAQIGKFLKKAKSRGLELTPVSAIATKYKG